MSVPSPIQRLSFQSWAHSVNHWVLDSQRDIFELDAPYQRGSVWTTEQRRNLIFSLLSGIPVGSIIYNVRSSLTINGIHGYVVDGKQRILAVRAFFDDELEVPAWWFEEDEVVNGREGMVTFSGLTVIGVRRMMHLPMPSLEAHVKTVEEEAAIFDLINTAGTAQTDDTIDRARAIAGVA
jgi:hypothetical protein